MTFPTNKINPNQGRIVVANRASSSLSILDESIGNVIETGAAFEYDTV